MTRPAHSPHKRRSPWAIRVLGVLGCAVVLCARAAAAGPSDLMVIVNASNKNPDPSLDEVREILTLQRQFWKDGKRIVLILPPSGSIEKNVLLRQVYRQSDEELRKTWARRLFAGEIPAVPTSVRSSDALVGAVKRSPGANRAGS